MENRAKLLILWSGRRGSNPRRPAWEAGILPLNYSRSVLMSSYPVEAASSNTPSCKRERGAARAPLLDHSAGAALVRVPGGVTA